MKKITLARQVDEMIPLFSPMIKDVHFGFRHILSVCKRLKAKDFRCVINEYKRLDEVMVFENQRFRKIIRVAALGE